MSYSCLLLFLNQDLVWVIDTLLAGFILNKAGFTGSLQRGWGREEPGRGLKMILGKGSGCGFALDWVLSKSKGNSMIFLIFFWIRWNKAGTGDVWPFLWFGRCSCFCLSLRLQSGLAFVLLYPGQSDLIFGVLWSCLCSVWEIQGLVVSGSPTPVVVPLSSHHMGLLQLVCVC